MDTTAPDPLEFAVGLRATHLHVVKTLGKRRFRAMMKELMPGIKLRAFDTKVVPAAAAFQFAQEAAEDEQRAAYIAVAVELRLREDGANGK